MKKLETNHLHFLKILWDFCNHDLAIERKKQEFALHLDTYSDHDLLEMGIDPKEKYRERKELKYKHHFQRLKDLGLIRSRRLKGAAQTPAVISVTQEGKDFLNTFRKHFSANNCKET